MDCANCGFRASPDARYCERCGADLTMGSLVPTSHGMVSPGGRPEEDARLWAVGAHVSAIAGGFLGGLPAFLGPLIVWLVRKDTDPYAAAHGRNALNFNLSVLLYTGILIVFTIVTLGLGALLTVPLWGLLGVIWLVLSIVATVKAANDELYRYPLTIPFVR